MFEDSLLESTGRAQSHRGRATAASFAVQSVLLATLALMPLLCTKTLPGRMWVPNAVILPPPPALGGSTQSHIVPRAVSEIAGGRLLLPKHIPQSIVQIVDEQAPSAASVVGMPYGVSEGIPNGILHAIPIPEAAEPPATPRLSSPPRLRVSQGVVEGLLIRQIKPAYPHLAMQTHTQGEVVLHAIIGRDGVVSSLELVRGHPLLAPAAIEAVREWRYRPYTLNGEPVEVETLITVRFVLTN